MSGGGEWIRYSNNVDEIRRREKLCINEWLTFEKLGLITKQFDFSKIRGLDTRYYGFWWA